MNYIKHYNLLIERARNRVLDCYSETHHVIPKCMNGTDDPSNLVKLTAEEHFVAHQLLVKIYPDQIKLIHALRMMTAASSNQIRNNKEFGWIKRKVNRTRLGSKQTDSTKKKISESLPKGKEHHQFGKPQPDHVKKAIKEANSGKKQPDTQIQNRIQKAAEFHAKRWFVDGQIVVNLAKWARDNKLNIGAIKTAIRDQRSYKDHTFQRLSCEN